MNAEIQFVNLDHSPSLEKYIQNKLDKLGDKFEWVVYAHVFIKEDNRPEEKNKNCEIRLSAPGPLIFAHESDYTYELAVADVIKQLEIQLEKRKGKMHPYL